MQLKVGTHVLRVLLLLVLASLLALTEARHQEPIFDTRPSPFNPNGPRTGGVRGGGDGFGGGGRGGFGGGRGW